MSWSFHNLLYVLILKIFSPPSCIWMVYRRGSWRYARDGRFLNTDLLAFAAIYGECNLIRVNLHRQGYLLSCSPDVSGSMIGGSKTNQSCTPASTMLALGAMSLQGGLLATWLRCGRGQQHCYSRQTWPSSMGFPGLSGECK